MGDTSIRLSSEAKQRLDVHKREGESYEDVILRLTESDKWAAFGIADSGAAVEGMERIRDDSRSRGTDRIEEYRE